MKNRRIYFLVVVVLACVGTAGVVVCWGLITLDAAPWGSMACNCAVVIWPLPPEKLLVRALPPENPSLAMVVFPLGNGMGGCPPENPPVFLKAMGHSFFPSLGHSPIETTGIASSAFIVSSFWFMTDRSKNSI